MSGDAVARVRVGAVLREALRERRLEGVTLVGPDGPERELLRRWLEAETVPLRDAAHGEVLLVGPETRTHLVLDGGRADAFPLGGVAATRVADWAGGVTAVRFLEGEGPDALPAVDRALGAFLDEGRSLADALAPLDPALADRIARRLRAGVPAARPPIVPKLEGWTPGVDPPL